MQTLVDNNRQGSPSGWRQNCSSTDVGRILSESGCMTLSRCQAVSQSFNKPGYFHSQQRIEPLDHDEVNVQGTLLVVAGTASAPGELSATRVQDVLQYVPRSSSEFFWAKLDLGFRKKIAGHDAQVKLAIREMQFLEQGRNQFQQSTLAYRNSNLGVKRRLSVSQLPGSTLHPGSDDVERVASAVEPEKPWIAFCVVCLYQRVQ
jgi:hypothetical protein